MRPATIHGYADRLSVAPLEPIEFKVSTDAPGTYRADVVRLIHGDTNPAGPGLQGARRRLARKRRLRGPLISPSAPART